MTQKQSIKLGEIIGLIPQIKGLAEAGGNNAISITENGKRKLVNCEEIFNAINTVSRLAEIEVLELAEKIEEIKTLLEIAINQCGSVTDKNGKSLSPNEILELVFDELAATEIHLNALANINRREDFGERNFERTSYKDRGDIR